jgi:hypothetical protein
MMVRALSSGVIPVLARRLGKTSSGVCTSMVTAMETTELDRKLD